MRSCAAGVLALLAVASSAPAAAVTVPRTPAGRTLSAFLEAFNSGDRARITAYVKRYWPKGPLDRILDVRRDSGGFELVRIEHADRLAIDFIVDDKSGPMSWLAHVEVDDGHPPRIVELRREEIPRGMTAAQVRVDVDAATRARVLDGVAHQLAQWYVYPDVAKKMIDALRAHQRLGEYDDLGDGYKLARAISGDLHAVSDDNHLSVTCTPETVPEDERAPPPLDREHAVDERVREELLRTNCGFTRIERLDGNIGHLKLDMLGAPSVCAPTAAAAMRFLAHVDALIVDLRDNGGGAPKMVAWLASYLFDTRTHLTDFYERVGDKRVESWTRDDVPGPRLGGKVPVYVLTSRRTFSGGEELAYDLKCLKRATIVGEQTGGGAHPTAPVRLDDHFVIHVPHARPVNPITKRDWEGTGVAPDVEAPAAAALDVAHKLATDALGARATPPQN